MAIDNYLADDEHILTEYKVKKEKFVATDRRLIVIKKDSMTDASYNHINSINVNIIKHKYFIGLGVVLFLIGIIIAAAVSPGGGIVFIVIGVIVMALYFIIKHSSYTISLSSGQQIPLPKTKSSNVDEFVKVIRNQVR